MPKFKHRKAVQLLNFFAIKTGGEINIIKALKLVWLADRLHLRNHGRPILHDTYYAMKLGPVASKTYNLAEDSDNLTAEERAYRYEYLSTLERYIFESIRKVNEKVFSKSDLRVMEKIYQEFGELEGFPLSDESHKYPEWRKFKKQLDARPDTRFAMSYDDFFLNAEQGNNSLFDNDETMLNIVKNIHEENTNICNILY